MRRFVRAAAVAGLLSLWAIPAQAADLTGGCTLEVRSFDGAGNALDTAVVAPTSDEGTEKNPFRIAWDGKVDFRFTTGATVFQNNTWSVSALNLPLLSGRDDNPMDLDESGTVTASDKVPANLRITGKFFVSGTISGNGGANKCDGSGWVEIIGDPIGTPLWLVGLGLAALGILILIVTPYTKDWEEGGYSAMPGGPVR